MERADRVLLLDATGARILVVDDNAANRELARTGLEMVGAQVSEAGGGEAASLIQAVLRWTSPEAEDDWTETQHVA